MGALQDYLNTIQLPKVKTDVEVKASASIYALVIGILAGLWLIFGKK